MKRLIQMVSIIATMAIVVAGTGTALAHKSGKGKNHKGPHGAFIMNATLTAATPATGATPVTGKARAVQNRKKVVFSGHLKGLAPAGAYTVGLFADTDGQGCASVANTVLVPPAFKAITGNEDGKGNIKSKVSVKTFALDSTADYYLVAKDSAGASVACGDLVLKKKSNKGKKK